MDETIRILLIDDEEDFYILIREILAEIPGNRYVLDWADSYDAALRVLKADQHTIWLVDYRLGAHDGLELMREALARGNKAPMILMTSQGDHEVDMAAMKIGASDYLPKHRIDAQTLERSIRYALERARSQEALRQSEEQLHKAQKSEALGRVAGGVAHNLNNTLTVISGYATMLSKGLEGNPTLRHEADEIQASAQHAAMLTRQLLAFSRKQLLNTKALNLNDVIAGIETMLRRAIGGNIEMQMELDETIGRTEVDPDQIGQVILNLAINARDAMPSGGKLTIQTTAVTQHKPGGLSEDGLPVGQYTVIVVSDTGSGMTGEVKRHLFEPFFTTKGPDKGTGLGLATSYGIIKQSGGYIQVYSEQGHGTTFRIYLPVVSDGAENVSS
ncbi:MAG: ATP-binding protein [Verrucomicrobia bacterium]|nr:ATP-binding protein [Verrucomicrobiota bacterium]